MINLRGVITVCTVVGLSMCISANASIINTINGNDYEWLELTATAGISRVDVEIALADNTSVLYGYRYATRVETEALLLSYFSMPVEYNQWNSYMVPGAQNFFADFGILFIDPTESGSLITIDGVSINYNMSINSYLMYGSDGECGVGVSCIGRMYTYGLDNVIQAVFAPARRGWDSSHADPDTRPVTEGYYTMVGSLLVNDVSAVPLPPAVYLFGSGMFGLVVIARRKITT